MDAGGDTEGKYNGYGQEAVETALHSRVSGRYKDHYGEKLKFWNVETVRGGCCGNFREQTQEGMKPSERGLIRCLVLMW
jgi:hypothetical protein